MTDNFDVFKSYISLITPNFDKNEDQHYVVELMRRGKDNPDAPAKNYHFKSYYIKKVEDLDLYKEEITSLCKLLRLRAYVSVNYKSFQQIMMDTVAETARRVAVHDYNRPYAIYDSCSGKYVADGNRIWLIDVDAEDVNEKYPNVETLAAVYCEFVRCCRPNKEPITLIPTKTGMHILTHPFDVNQFNQFCTRYGLQPHNESSHPLIKKNHLTLLYEDL